MREERLEARFALGEEGGGDTMETLGARQAGGCADGDGADGGAPEKLLVDSRQADGDGE